MAFNISMSSFCKLSKWGERGDIYSWGVCFSEFVGSWRIKVGAGEGWIGKQMKGNISSHLLIIIG